MKCALVVGAGIAGPVLAVGLRRVGFTPRIIEAYPEGASRDAGSWLTLAVNGIAALRTLGLQQAGLDVSFPSRDVELLNGAGRGLGVASLGSSSRTARRPRRSSARTSIER
jgi:2-polyprenyl-6-methoxyphenol hydroxylase-like FAD-dependent oxidoreductase